MALPEPPSEDPKVPPADGNDALLLSQAKAGSMLAFEQLVTAHQNRVYGIALRMLRSEADAAEVTQDVFLSAYQNLKAFRGESAFGSWVHRIAANAALMRLRHRKVAQETEVDPVGPEFNERESLIEDVADWAENAESRALSSELRAAIEQATAQLPESFRQVFLLRDVEGFRYDEIAELTQLSLASVKTRLHRARLAMREAIGQFYQQR